MLEDQSQEVLKSSSLGIRVGKVQVSSAIQVRWQSLDASEQQQALEQLSQFAEDRYLHQTLVVDSDGNRRLIEDLPLVLHRYLDRESHAGLAPISDQEWRIHFHVPIYVSDWGRIESTQSQIKAWIELIKIRPDLFHEDLAYEVETYAWGVLPAALKTSTLDEGIAKEISWLQKVLYP
jgi:hypothetical protein